jgi:hypothetical protein
MATYKIIKDRHGMGLKFNKKKHYFNIPQHFNTLGAHTY